MARGIESPTEVAKIAKDEFNMDITTTLISGLKGGSGKSPKKNLKEMAGTLFEDVKKVIDQHGAENVEWAIGLLK
jgi:hypothetical protein